MKIGVRAHDYGKHSIEGLASLLREEGYDGAQLALPKVFEEIDSYEDIRLSHIERIRRAFEKNRVEIPVMGCYMDLGNPDRSVREYFENLPALRKGNGSRRGGNRDSLSTFEQGGKGCLVSVHDGQPYAGYGGGAAH